MLFQHRPWPEKKENHTSPFVQLQLPAFAELHLLLVFGFQPRTKTWISGFSGFRHWKNSLVSRNCQNASAWMKPHLLGFGFKSGSYIVELKGMKNLVDSLTESLAPRPWKQYGPAAALSALFPAGGMAKGGSVKTSNGSALFPAGGMAKGGSVKTSNGSALFPAGGMAKGGSVKTSNGCGTTRCTSVQIRHLWHVLRNGDLERNHFKVVFQRCHSPMRFWPNQPKIP